MEPEYSSQILVRMKLACAITFCCVPDLSLRARSLLFSQDLICLAEARRTPPVVSSITHIHFCSISVTSSSWTLGIWTTPPGQKGVKRGESATRRNPLKKETACTRKGHLHVYSLCEYVHVASLVHTFSSRRDGHVCGLSERQLRISRSVYPPSFGRTPINPLAWWS